MTGHATRRGVRALALAAAACFTVSVVAVVPSGAAGQERQRAILTLKVNGVENGDIFVLVDGKDLWAEVGALEGAGLKGLAGLRLTDTNRTLVSLRSLAPAITFEFDEPALELRVKASPDAFGSTTVAVDVTRPAGVVYARSTSAFFNYALNYHSGLGVDASGEAGIQIAGMALSSTVSRRADGAWTRGFSRLTIDDRARLTRWTIGDAIAATGVLGGGGVVGGVTVARDYGLDPYFVRHPTLGFTGALDTASTVDIYVNGQFVSRQDLPPGPFRLDNLAAPSGRGETRYVIRDAFGRERDYQSSYYLTNAVLAAGLQEYSYTAGWMRSSGGTGWVGYLEPALLASHRIGVTGGITVGGRLEASRSLLSGGPTLNARLWQAGEIELAVGVSRHDGRTGAAWSAAYSYFGRVFAASAAVRSFDPAYAVIGASETGGQPRMQVDLSGSVRISRRVGVSIQETVRRSSPQAAGAVTAPGAASGAWLHRTTLRLQSQLSRRLSLFVSATYGRDSGGLTRSVMAGASISLGNRTSGLVSVDASAAGISPRLEVQRSLPVGEGLGYRVRLATALGGLSGGSIEYQTSFGRYTLDQTGLGNSRRTDVGVSGGIVAIGGGVFLTRTVQDSFALIRVPGIKGVTGYASNQTVGKTDARGNLLVPNLLPYYGNELGIRDQDVPLNYSLASTSRRVAPPYQGGAVVTFLAERLTAIVGVLQMEIEGRTVVPANGRLAVFLAGREVESPIGRGGEFYLENVPPGRYRAVVEFGDAGGEFTMVIPESQASVIKLGTILVRGRLSTRP